MEYTIWERFHLWWSRILQIEGSGMYVPISIFPRIFYLEMEIYAKQKRHDQYENIKTNNCNIKDLKPISVCRSKQNQDQITQE